MSSKMDAGIQEDMMQLVVVRQGSKRKKTGGFWELGGFTLGTMEPVASPRIFKWGGGGVVT